MNILNMDRQCDSTRKFQLKLYMVMCSNQSGLLQTLIYAKPKQEAHGPHRSPEKTVQIN